MQKRSMFFLIILSALLISIPIYAFLIWPNLGNTVDWTMHGVVVNSQGEVNKYTEYQVGQFTVSGSIHDEADKIATMKLRIIMTENFRYMFDNAGHPNDRTKYISMNRKYTDEPYYVFSHFTYDRFANESTFAYMALDQEKEFMIFNWDDDKDLYLVASTDPDTDPNEILAYFQKFIEDYDESHRNK